MHVLELYGGGLENLGVKVQAGKFLHALGRSAHRLANGHAVGAREPGGLGRHAHGLHVGEARVRNVQQRVFFTRINRQMVFAGHRGINEFQHHVLADAFDVTVTPSLKRIGGGLSATLFLGTNVRPAARVGVYFISRPVHDVDSPAIRLPARNPGGEMLVGVSDAAVVLLFEFIFLAAGIRIAPIPKILNKRLFLFVSRELLERIPLFFGDDVGDFLVNPLLKSGFIFLLGCFLPALLFPAHLFFLFRGLLWLVRSRRKRPVEMSHDCPRAKQEKNRLGQTNHSM